MKTKSIIGFVISLIFITASCGDRCDVGTSDHIRSFKMVDGVWTQFKDTVKYVAPRCIGDRWEDTKVNAKGEFVLDKHNIK